MRSNEYVPPRIYRSDAQLHGSAKWATREHLKKLKYGEDGRIFLGYGVPEHNKQRSFAITTSTARHGTVLGPTRSGKGICFTVPHCLNHQGSLVVMDIKDGENALITARYRRDVLGQNVYLIDPWDCVSSKLDMPASRFNPLDWLDPDDPGFVDNSFLVAESLVVSDQAREPFWSDESRSVISGLSMYVKTAPLVLLPDPEKGRTLGQVRACLNLGPKAFKQLVNGEWEKDEDDQLHLVTPGMAQSPNEHVRAAAGRLMNKSDRERSGVLSTAQSNTHFLEGPLVQEALSKSDFDPAELEKGNTTVIIAMQTDKHHTHDRFLRLMISILMTTAARFTVRPNPPVSFLLEEANALGHLPQIPTAYSLLAGQGMQVISIWQDLNQMATRYEKNWQTIVANSGFIQVLATRDYFTAEYLSKMCGTTTIEHVSESSAASRAGLIHDPRYLSRDDALHGRPLITPDEIMTMHPCAQLLLLAHAHPVTAYKTAYFLDDKFRKGQQPLFDIHPHFADVPLSKSVDFTKSGQDIGGLLEDILDGG